MMPFLAFLPLAAALSTATPADALSATECDFGIALPWSEAICTVMLENTSDADLTVVLPGASEAGGTQREVAIPAGKFQQVGLPVAVGGTVGARGIAMDAKVRTTQGSELPLRVVARGFVYSPIDPADLTMDLGPVEAGDSTPSVLGLSSEDSPKFAVATIEEAPEFVRTDLKEGSSLQVQLSDKARWGLNSGEVVLRLAGVEQKIAKVMVTADVLGTVRPAQNPLSLGVIRRGPDQGFGVRLIAMDDKPLRVGAVSYEMGLKASSEVEACPNEGEACRMLNIRIDPEQRTGNLASRVVVELPDYKQTLAIGLSGVLLDPDVGVRTLDEPPERSNQAAPAAGADIMKALQQKAAERLPPPADPAGEGPVLRWAVAHERNLYGYLIYRADAEDGPWQRVNDQIIPVLGQSDATSQYAWRDTTAEKDRDYWYFIKTLARDGRKEKLTLPRKVSVR